MSRYAIIIFVLCCSSQQNYVQANDNQEIVTAIENLLENKFGQMINMLSTGRDNFLLYTQEKMDTLVHKCSRCLNTTEIGKTLQEQTLSELRDIKGSMFQEIQILKDKIDSFEHMISCDNSPKNITDHSDEYIKTVDDHVHVTEVIPNNLQYTTESKLSLVINNLPSVEGDLRCVFSALGKNLSTKANITAEGFSCNTPRPQFLPYISHPEHHFVATLSVRKWEGPEFVRTNFTFFDCSSYSSCTDCVSSIFPCDWCVENHRCEHNSADKCWNDVVINGVNQDVPSIRSGPSFCPRITSFESQEILMPVGVNKTIKVKVENVQFVTLPRFVCQFNINGRRTSVNANLLNDTIYCDPLLTSFLAAPTTNATFDVIWGRSWPLDNPDNIHVILYQCHLMADNCNMCVSLPERKFRCGWCESKDKCKVKDNCFSSSPWRTSNKTCPGAP